MPKIPEYIIRRIQDAAKIEDVVSDCGVKLRKAGVNLTGLCPFHEDRHTGNFIVRPSTISEKDGGNTYRCFVCDKKGGPVTFLMEHERLSFPDAIRWLGKKYCIEVDNVPVNYTPPPPRPAPPPLPRLTFKRQTVADSMKGIEQTLFVKWLHSLPWDAEQRARLRQVLHLYCVATCPHGPEWVSFWQITHDGVPLTAKYMRYHADGHRVKDRDEQGRKVFASDWEHAYRARMGQYDRAKYDTNGRALFGAHLLNRYPQAVVNVVESEKTALIMATYYGNFAQQLWVACGGVGQLKLDVMQPLIDQGRTVWLWPDRDGQAKWQQVADKLGYDRCHVYTHFLDTCWTESDGPKADVADIAIRMMRTGEGSRQETNTGDGQGATETNATAAYHSGATSAPTPEDIALKFKPDSVTDEEWLENSAIMRAIKEWKLEPVEDEPFIDSIELQDPRVREWREKLRNTHKPKQK